MTQREAFEAWARTRMRHESYLLRDLDGEGEGYEMATANAAWAAWQAATERHRGVVEAARGLMDYPDDSKRLQALEDALAALDGAK